jgi:hypothetical protein
MLLTTTELLLQLGSAVAKVYCSKDKDTITHKRTSRNHPSRQAITTCTRGSSHRTSPYFPLAYLLCLVMLTRLLHTLIMYTSLTVCHVRRTNALVRPLASPQRGVLVRRLAHDGAREATSASSSQTASRKSASNKQLSFESFEFGAAPKWDRRFGADRHLADDPSLEADRDRAFSARLAKQNSAWNSLSQETVAAAINTLKPYVRPERIDRITAVLKQRTVATRFLFENPSNPSNIIEARLPCSRKRACGQPWGLPSG